MNRKVLNCRALVKSGVQSWDRWPEGVFQDFPIWEYVLVVVVLAEWRPKGVQDKNKHAWTILLVRGALEHETKTVYPELIGEKEVSRFWSQPSRATESSLARLCGLCG